MNNYKATARAAFNPEYGQYYLPEFLNANRVSLADFRSLNLNTRPDVVAALMFHRPGGAPRLAHRKWVKRYIATNPSASAFQMVAEFLRTFYKADVMPYVKRLEAYCEKTVEHFRLYTDENGVIQTEIRAGFSLNAPGEADSDYYAEWACPSCRKSSEGTVDDTPDQFEHISGPYFACESCYTIGRPKVTEGFEPPNEEAWDDYVEHLDEIIKSLQEDLLSKGLPELDHLAGFVNNADWRGRTASFRCEPTGEALARVMSVDSHFYIDDGKLILPLTDTGYLTCILAHHDATSSITVTPGWEDSDPDTEELITGDDVYDAIALGEVVRIFGWERCDRDVPRLSRDGFENMLMDLDRDWEGRCEIVQHWLGRMDPGPGPNYDPGKMVCTIVDAKVIRQMMDVVEELEAAD